MTRPRKLFLIGLGAVLAVPVVLYLGLLTWFYFKDESTGTLVSSGQTRRYLLHVPRSYHPARPAPLVISLHGAALWPAVQRNVSRWNEVAEEHGFLVVYPAANDVFGIFPRGPRAWNLGPGGVQRNVIFLSELIDKLAAEYNIDPARIYVDGLSNGGAMAFVTSCRLPQRVAAVGAVAAAYTPPFAWCGEDAPPMPMVGFHGTADRMVPYEGGMSSDPVHPRPLPHLRQWTADWARRNRCAAEAAEEPVSAAVRRLAYSQCAANAAVVLYTVEGGGHTWPGGQPFPEWMTGPTTQEISASRLMWDFFARHPRAPTP
jgi:polyhydroxybutyrate depolymerase